MAIKKSDLYSKLWASCDELRGGMDASQYKDYVLVLLFIKYISDKYKDKPFAEIKVPEGASFADMVALKGKSDIGDQINKKIVHPLEVANRLRIKADFNDDALLGQGKEKVDKLTNLIGIFESKDLDFSKHRADGDDILGDAYEYLMRHFATESGKSKGQFYTPAEVSRIIARVIGISRQNTKASTTAYDPTCGSGSLLLKVAAEAGKHITLEGQEMDVTTAGLARMNMILHDFPTANVVSGNTLASPKFKDGEQLRAYDYVVANPPFSLDKWGEGLHPFGAFTASGADAVTHTESGSAVGAFVASGADTVAVRFRHQTPPTGTAGGRLKPTPILSTAMSVISSRPTTLAVIFLVDSPIETCNSSAPSLSGVTWARRSALAFSISSGFKSPAI